MFEIFISAKVKSLILIILLLLLTYGSNGQSKKAELGFSGGLTLASMRGQSYAGKTPRQLITPALGISINFPVKRYFEIAATLDYENKGYSYGERTIPVDALGNTTVGTEKWKYQYLNMAILARGMYGEDFKAFINTGPYVSYLLGARQIFTPKSVELINGVVYSGSSQDINNYFNRIDYGIVAGLGLLYPFSKTLKLTAELRTSIPLTPMNKENVVIQQNMVNKSLLLLLGIRMKL